MTRRAKYPGWRHMTAAQRYNARKDAIFEAAERQGWLASDKDKNEFRAYLRQCTDAQVQGVWEKEQDAGRHGYAELAKDEGYRRNIFIG